MIYLAVAFGLFIALRIANIGMDTYRYPVKRPLTPSESDEIMAYLGVEPDKGNDIQQEGR